MRNKVLKTLGYVRNFTYLGAANITGKQKSDMTKVAIKNENITSFGGIYHIMDVSQSWALKNLPNLYWANVEVAAKHSVMEVFFVVFHTSPLVWVESFLNIKSPYQWINLKNVTSIYKSTSQGIMLRN